MIRLARAPGDGQLSLVEAAIETYRQVLEREMENADGDRGVGATRSRAEEYELEIADILGPLYRTVGDYQKLVGVYEVQVRRSDDPMRAVELLAREWLSFMRMPAAISTPRSTRWLERWRYDPGAGRSLRMGLERLANATDRFADLARVYETLAQRGKKEPKKNPVSSILPSRSTRSARPSTSTSWCTSILRCWTTPSPTIVGSCSSTTTTYRRSNHSSASSARPIATRSSARCCNSARRCCTTSTIRSASLMQSAQIEEEVLERLDNAVAVYNKVLEIDAEDLAALDALIKLYIGMEKWAELLEVYNRKVDLVFDADERKRIYYQMGAVYEGELGQVREAIDTYQRVLEIDPDDLTALGRLDVLYQQAEDWPELLNILQREADLAADPMESISYQYRIAELYDKRLDDVQRAIELYRDLLAQMSDHEPTLEALEALTRGERAPLEAAQVLEPIYDALGEWTKLIEVLEVQGRATEDPYQRVELLHRIARLYEEMLNDPNAAFDTYARAVAADVSNDESLAQYERLASMVQRWADLAALYDEQLQTLGIGSDNEDPVRFGEIGLRLARIYEEQLEDFDRAIERFNLVLEQEPDNAEAIASLDRLYEMTERWEQLATILSKEAELAATGDEILNFRFRLAQVQQYRLNDIGSAIIAYGEVIQEMPEHEGALQALEGMFAEGVEQLRIAEVLEPHYENLGQYDQMGNLYEAVLSHKSDPEERKVQYYRLAELHEERLLAPDASLAVFIRALQEYPNDERTLEDTERLAAIVEDGWEHVANAYADVLGAHEDTEVQRLAGKRLARVFEEELGDIEKAEETYRYVLSVAPLESECLENLDRIYSAMEQYPELAQVLEQRVLAIAEAAQAEDMEPEPYQLIEFYTRLGVIYEEQLAQLDDAVRSYRKIFAELEPDNQQAQEALERLYSQQEKWQELYGVYDKMLETAPGDMEKADVSAKKARVLSDYLGEGRARHRRLEERARATRRGRRGAGRFGRAV